MTKQLLIFPAWSCPYVEPWRTPFQGGWAATFCFGQQHETIMGGGRQENERTLVASAILESIAITPPTLPVHFVLPLVGISSSVELDPDRLFKATKAYDPPGREAELFALMKEQVSRRRGKLFMRRPQDADEVLTAAATQKAATNAMFKFGPRPRRPRSQWKRYASS